MRLKWHACNVVWKAILKAIEYGRDTRPEAEYRRIGKIVIEGNYSGLYFDNEGKDKPLGEHVLYISLAPQGERSLMAATFLFRPRPVWRFFERSPRRDIAPAMEVLDFVRALNERPAWVKLLFRLVVGKYAYREFLFIVKNIRDSGYEPFYEYSLNHHEYHGDEQPWFWWHDAHDAARDERKK